MVTLGSTEVYKVLRSKIVNGELEAGSKLVETHLGKMMNVSRTPVRQALIRLAADGLVEVLPNRGARVRKWTTQDVLEVFEIRAVLEGQGAGKAARNRDEQSLLDLDILCNQMEDIDKVFDKKNRDRMSELNTEFHQKILLMSGSTILPAIVVSMSFGVLTSATFQHYTEDRIQQSLSQHREVVSAIRAGDSLWAESVMKAHLMAARNVLTLDREPTIVSE
jgi:DNA-binding GntR family transcriptional regulator